MEINGTLTNSVLLGRSIRQGFPLALALFVIATEVLYFLLRDNMVSPKVRGLILPNDNELINIHFYDDTTIFINLKEENFNNLVKKLNIFSVAFGAKVSKPKSTLLSCKTSPQDGSTR